MLLIIYRSPVFDKVEVLKCMLRCYHLEILFPGYEIIIIYELGVVLLFNVPWKSILRCEHRVCQLRIKCKIKMAQRQNIMFCGREKVLLINIDFGNRS